MHAVLTEQAERRWKPQCCLRRGRHDAKLATDWVIRLVTEESGVAATLRVSLVQCSCCGRRIPLVGPMRRHVLPFGRGAGQISRTLYHTAQLARSVNLLY